MILAIIIILSLLMITSAMFAKKANFVVGDRDTGVVQGAISIAATWIWAPALFVSTQQAFTNGFVGFLCFLIPNILCLILFAPYANRLRKKHPNGFNFPDIIGRSKRTNRLYKFNFSTLSLLSISVQLLAGAQILTVLTGWGFFTSTLILLAVALSYTIARGYNSSIITDVVQYTLMGGSALLLLAALKIDSLQFTGIENNITSFFSGDGLMVLLGFGIPTALSLLSGPFGDGTFYQRALAIKKDKVFKTFVLSSALFALIPITLGIIGFAAAADGFQPDKVSNVGMEYIAANLPAVGVYVVFVMLLAGLLSTIDSHLSFLSSLGKKYRTQIKIMLLLPIISVLIANIPGNTVALMFLFYGLFRASSLVTNIHFLSGVKLKESSIFYSVILTQVLAFLPFAIGNLYNIVWLKIAGTLLTIAIPLAIIYINERLIKRST